MLAVSIVNAEIEQAPSLTLDKAAQMHNRNEMTYIFLQTIFL